MSFAFFVSKGLRTVPNPKLLSYLCDCARSALCPRTILHPKSDSRRKSGVQWASASLLQLFLRLSVSTRTSIELCQFSFLARVVMVDAGIYGCSVVAVEVVVLRSTGC